MNAARSSVDNGLINTRQYEGLLLRSPMDNAPIIELRGYMGVKNRAAMAALVFHQLYENRAKFGFAQVVGESAWEWHTDLYDWRVDVSDEFHATLHGHNRAVDRDTVEIRFRLERFGSKQMQGGDNRWHLVRLLDEEVMKNVDSNARESEVLSAVVHEQDNGCGVSESVLRLVEDSGKRVRRNYVRTTSTNRVRRPVEENGCV